MLVNYFLDMTLKHDWTSIKLKLFSLKDTVKEVKRQATDWEKNICKHVSDKELVSRIYKNFSKFDKKATSLLWAELCTLKIHMLNP